MMHFIDEGKQRIIKLFVLYTSNVIYTCKHIHRYQRIAKAYIDIVAYIYQSVVTNI